MSDDVKGLKAALKEQMKARAKAGGKQLKQLVKELAPEQRDALMKRLSDQKKAAPLVAREPGAEAPLSFAQEREWFRNRLHPDVAHNISGALRLTGTLSIEALRAAFDAIVARHETLRARFENETRMTITEPSRVPLRFIEYPDDWRALYAEEIARNFDIGADLLLRTTLIRLADDEHVLLVTMHHIAADGWSIGVLMRELSELYTAHVEGREPRLPELPVAYGDFARWQRARPLTKGLAYWRKQLDALPPVLELDPDLVLHGDESAERDHDAASCTSHIEPALRQRLEAVSRDEETTLFVTLLTAFKVLLLRCTGREDLVVGSPVSGRTRVETERLIGLFLNTLALRTTLSREMTFREAVAAVRETVLDALEYANVPIERVVQDLDVARTAGVHPLYETIFNFTPAAPRRLELPRLDVGLEDPPALIEEFSTQLFIAESDGALELDLRYRARRYSEARMAAFAEQYLAVLEQIASDPASRIGALDLVTPRSRDVIADPALTLDEPPQTPVVESIRGWIARTPEAIAVEQGEERLTYAAFGAGVDALASELRERGVENGDVVAVTGPRGIDVIVAMTAVFAAKGVLLTLSKDLPEQRRAVMLEESQAQFVIDGRGISRLGGRDGRRYTEAAYLFFTSGSTGKPKGVLGTHQGLAHWLRWQRETFAVGPGDRCGQLTGLSFDVVLRDVFLALTSGATLVVPTESDDVLHWLDRVRITRLHSVPAVAESWLLAKASGVTLEHLRTIFFAGEPLTSSLVARWREAFPRGGEIVNIYGPTETTLAKCFYRVPETARAGVQPLGRPLPQTQVLVLTPERAQCAVGEPGEIAIRTPFRSRGYVNAPEENEKRFVAWGQDVIYLTGDRGVIGADGLLEFRGRVDHQVKIRGVRVEPMEVTVALQACPGVVSCAVVAREDESGAAMLVAYVVSGDPDIARLHDFLAQRLPAAMVPGAFVFLDALPLTANGKLDRERLPEPSRAREGLASRYVAPRDAIELRLVEVWEELLGVHPIGVTDRFFEVGGHSLLALRLLVEIEQRLGSKVPLPALFEEPTIEHLAAVLRRKLDAWPTLVTLRGGEGARKLFLVHPGGGILWNYIQLVRHLPPDLPVFGLQARGLDGRHLPHSDIAIMAADYIAEVRRAQPDGPYLLAGHSLGGMIAFEMARQLDEGGERVELLAMFDTSLPRTMNASMDERERDARSLAEMARTIERFVGKDIGVTYEQLSELGSDEQVEYVAGALERHDALPKGHGTELTRHLLTVSKSHVRASRAYVARQTSVPITLIRARDAEAALDETLGWQHYTTRPVRVLWAPGDHVTMMAEPNVAIVADAIKGLL
jgi:amino acid adenylation domain-containing protein